MQSTGPSSNRQRLHAFDWPARSARAECLDASGVRSTLAVMKLKLVHIRLYKRFEAESRLDARGPVIAVVGPNEAGKTSLLKALAHISSHNPFDGSESTDREARGGDEWMVRADFSLDGDDMALLGEIVPSETDLTYSHWRHANGEAKYSIRPHILRDRASRAAARSALREELDAPWLAAIDADGDAEEEGEQRIVERARALEAALASEDETLPGSVVEELTALSGALQEGLPEDVDIPRAEVARLLGLAAVDEGQPTPSQRINQVLSPRVPRFLLFTDAERDLGTDYSWNEHAEPPAALANLLALARADYQELRAAAMSDDRATLETLQEEANERLDAAFEAWRQGDIHVALSAHHSSLQILVRDRTTRKRTRLEERSAGLRSFVALIAFTARHAGAVPPVLLIDEAETHLHYDAQADLVRVFERQRVAAKIIYTTHSIGCLPSDIGATIRVVSPLNGPAYRSTIYNSFWAAEGTAGLTPVMLAMGANALAFTPSRRAVIAEGASDAILLPSLIREALPPDQQNEPLGYQVAPGVADVHPDAAADLELEAGGVAYLVDGDSGGRGHRRKLSERAKGEGRVVVLSDGQQEGLSTEDFVAAAVLAEAFNRVVARRGSGGIEMVSADDLPAVGRAAFLDARCKAAGFQLPKTALAQEALDIGRDAGALADPSRLEDLRRLHEQLLTATDMRESAGG